MLSTYGEKIWRRHKLQTSALFNEFTECKWQFYDDRENVETKYIFIIDFFFPDWAEFQISKWLDVNLSLVCILN